MFRQARYFAWGLILAPLILVALWLIITYMPGVASFLKSTFWGLLGQISVFSLASELLQSFVTASAFSLEDYMAHLIPLLLQTLSDSLIIACCIFLVKTICTRFNRKWQGRFTKPVWLMTLIGVVIGVAVCQIKGLLAVNGSAILTLVVCLGCYIGGLMLLLRSIGFTKGGTYHNRWAGFVISLLLGIVGDLLDALCGVLIITLLLNGAYYLQQGGSSTFYMVFLIASALIPFAKEVLLELLQPQNV